MIMAIVPLVATQLDLSGMPRKTDASARGFFVSRPGSVFARRPLIDPSPHRLRLQLRSCGYDATQLPEDAEDRYRCKKGYSMRIATSLRLNERRWEVSPVTVAASKLPSWLSEPTITFSNAIAVRALHVVGYSRHRGRRETLRSNAAKGRALSSRGCQVPDRSPL